VREGGQIQVPGFEETIDSRNTLWKRRDRMIAALRALHGGKLAPEVADVSRATAQDIIDQDWERDVHGAPYDIRLIRRALHLRDGLRKAIYERSTQEQENRALRHQARAEVRELEVAWRDQRASSAAGLQPGHGFEESAELKKLKQKWLPQLQDSDARVEAARAESDRLSAEFMNATKDARCFSLPFGDDLDRALIQAQSGERIAEAERWDIAMQIWRRFGGPIYQGGIRGERVVLARRDDAIAYTLLARALLSPEPSEDLLARELSELEDSRLRDRRGEPGVYRGLSTHKLASYLVWPSGEGRIDVSLPIDPELRERLVILDEDPRLERFIAVAEVAYAAVTGESLPADGQMDVEQDAAPRSRRSRRNKSRRSPGRPPSSKVKEDEKLYADYKQSGLTKAEFEKERGLEPEAVEDARNRIKARRADGRNPRKRR
jgi:hypothetical protein